MPKDGSIQLCLVLIIEQWFGNDLYNY